MSTIFHFSNYRALLKKRLNELPKKGYGQSRKLALFLNCHTTLISHVLKGLRDFTPEQAILAAEFLGMNETETEFFLLLVNLERAGNEPLRRNIRQKIEHLRAQATELVHRLSKQKVLTEAQKAIFYSDWSYSAIRQCSGIKGLQNIESIAQRLSLPRKHVAAVLDFLIETGLCKRESSRFVIGPSSTHLESSSPWVKTHHTNWRQKALAALNNESPTKMHYSAPMSLSSHDAALIREKLAKLLEDVDKIVEPSPFEELHCLNIDWFKI